MSEKESGCTEDKIMHNDHVAISALDEHQPPSEKELRRLMWKLDLRIIPYVALLYLCFFLDRVNIGNAKIAGMVEDMGITESQYNWGLSIFFIGYILFEVPSNMILKLIGPRICISSIMILWGTFMAAMAACHNASGLMAARSFLGVAEAGLYPGVIFYLSMWYTRRELAFRFALFFGSSTLAGTFGGLLAYGIMHMDGIQGLHGWQWIFILEAIPTLILGCLTYFVMPDFPETTSFLNEREREIILNRLKKDAGQNAETHFSWKQVWSAFLDWKTYLYAIMFLCGGTSVYSLSMFMPSIIHGVGFTALTAQAMSAPPYTVGFIVTVFTGWSSDRRNERGTHLAVFSFLACIGYMLLIVLRDKDPVALYISTIIALASVFSTNLPTASWYSSNYRGYKKRAVAIATIMSIGNCGGVVAGQVYRADDAPHYV